MGKASRVRRLRASELARQDQYEAMAGDLARKGAAIFLTSYAAPGTLCGWCPCALAAGEPSPNCPGPCDAEAPYVLKLFYGTPGQVDAPLCAEHYEPMCREVRAANRRRFGDVPTEFHYVNIRDENQR